MNTDNQLARETGEALQRRGWTLATAESCTGGLIGALITAIPGSSAYYVGGIIAYSNEVKMTHLAVSTELLASAGAVSAESAQAMAEGVRSRIGADIAVATTGIAGPGGGAAEKPVGLVYVAVATADRTRCERFLFDGDRIANQQAAAREALNLLLAVCGAV